MPNFNGAIVMHTLQLIKTPATLREIVVTIAKNIDLPQDDLMKPVKQTLDMGYRMGFLQKLNGRYFLVPMSFDTLRTEMRSMSQQIRAKPDVVDKVDLKPKMEKRTGNKQLQLQHQLPLKALELFNKSGMLDAESTTTLMAGTSGLGQTDALMHRKPKRSQQPVK
ncbi:uncharacterized protein LOC111594190 [Drosophila hydei]|uniref:Uncharacterized protein LOC111594190 n=1 Tax=Drosophila hydei TaxID=7224 RepID=A0A6J1LCY0_DROHY|nr:uncharacterized protein LOC111594190 [Drosophila hydei]